MRVLAIDTALANCAAAVLGGSAPLVSRSETIGRGHAERLMTMIGDVMAESSTAFSDLDRIVVTTGPGSFTGLRVGLSVARGFGLVLGKPVIGITTLAAIAAGLAAEAYGRPLVVALEARNGEAYVQAFNAAGQPADEPAVRQIADLAASLPDGACLAGSAARDVAVSAGLSDDRVLSDCAFADIGVVARLGQAAEPGSAPVPLYLRAPDARPQVKGRIERL
ncbi:tRNA (adenosine(37)-N6)-threonylcarbamoyltransferase complex dimerization subunit type 1 TsaB [Polymorphum gilvum]|uniref:Glycoprotease family n=1 Tax=Polymorphum gilvum (strain LMG 25793 / CGMCC 1.9160 / SL003B-26A1) TaxID=991905 RepID=F2IVL7_POLGS|nr:tRNA (adenosine(37)-N6)-threonylcarbamoyltransferase complex dimerization subunit type 1 TsaB [Polymorphum gilvum]ADZ72734.1 Glycoprotease family [Polymorphum gilvum SL003B-26A1]